MHVLRTYGFASNVFDHARKGQEDLRAELENICAAALLLLIVAGAGSRTEDASFVGLGCSGQPWLYATLQARRAWALGGRNKQ